MSLLFNAITEQVDFGDLSISQNQFTALVWVNPSNVDATFRQICGEDRAGTETLRMMTSTSTAAGQLRFQAKFDLKTISNSGVMVANVWQYLAFRFDNSDATQKCRIYRGTLTSAAVEVGYSTVDETGSPPLGASNPFIVGRGSAGSFPFDGKAGNIVVYNNKALTLNEIIAHQFSMMPKTTGAVLYSELGWSGVTNQVDWSGNKNNGTITGATVDDHVPLVYEDEAPLSPYIVASVIPLAAASISSDTEAVAGAVTQTHELTGVDASSDTEAVAGAVTQTHELTGLDASSDTEAVAGAVTQTHELTGGDASSDTEAVAGAVTQTHELTGGDASSDTEAVAGAVTQTHELTGVDASSDTEVIAIALINGSLGPVKNTVLKSATVLRTLKSAAASRNIISATPIRTLKAA